MPDLCVTEEDFKTMNNFIALAAATLKVKILVHTIMVNHIHVICNAEKENCVQFLKNVMYKYSRYLRLLGRPVDMSAFANEEPILLTSLNMIRNEIAYVVRNPFVDMNYTPYGYPWGSGGYLMNPSTKYLAGMSFPKMKILEKRALIHSKDIDGFDHFKVLSGMILPDSFCDIELAESLFNSPREYFTYISKHFENYSEIAKRLGDSACLSETELFYVAQNVAKENFGISNLTLLNIKQRMDVARYLHRDYNAPYERLSRILKLDVNVLKQGGRQN